jgi:TolC family type I secretion outer membrane protein
MRRFSRHFKTPRDSLFDMTRLKSTSPARGLFAALVGVGIVLAAPATAQTLNEALAAAYESNPTLRAQRAQLRATDEGLPEALAGWRPIVTVEGQAGVGTADSGVASQDLQPLSYGLFATQPLYRGGRTTASTSRADNLILAERALLASVEQRILLEAATVYMNVARNLKVLELNIRNEQVLERELNATQDRFRVGELTLTDVAQARARLAGAVAGRIQAEGNLQTLRAEYLRIIGRPAESPQPPPALEGLPLSIEEMLAFSDENNPDIVAARHQEQASLDDIRFARGELLPTLSLDGQVEHREDFGSSGSESDTSSLMARLSIPLYQGGGPSARVRRAKQVAGQRRIQLDETRRAIRAQATSSWEILAVARARVSQFESQVEANKTALEGTREQARVGSRILLDVLNAEQELLDAQVSLEVAKRDSFVAGLEVLVSIGRLTARDLSLDVEYYDESAYYEDVKGKLGGTDTNE